MLKDYVQAIWNIVTQVMAIELPVAEYKITFTQLFIYGIVSFLIMVLLFGLGSKKGEK